MRSVYSWNYYAGIFGVVMLWMSGCLPKETAQPVQKDGGTWTRIGPGGGGATFIPTFSYHSGEQFLVKCDMTGSYLSKDGGNSYAMINIAGGVSCFAFDPIDSNNLYIGSSVLWKSADGGASWQQLFPKPAEISREYFLGDHADYGIVVADSSLYVQEAGKISNIKADPAIQGGLYFTMGNYFFYSVNGGNSWSRQNLKQPISYLYTNADRESNNLYVFTATTIFVFDKKTHDITEIAIPAELQPLQSFTAGKIRGSDSTLVYALHHDLEKKNPWDFGHSQVLVSRDMGINWAYVTDANITNQRSGINPSLTMISCAENDAANAYVVTNRYEEKSGDKLIQWYGALKTPDGGKTWDWSWKGGGGSGQYGVQDAADAPNLQDAWVHNAFGGEFIQLFDVGVAPNSGNTAIVTDWYRTMKTIDGGKFWREIYSRANNDSTYTSRGMDVTTAYGVHFDPFDSAHIAISYTDIGYHHSFDGGRSWSRSVDGVPIEWVNTCYWMAFDPAVKGRIWSAWSGLHDFPRGKMTRNPAWKENGRGGICISDDGGKSWRPSITGMGMNSPATSVVLDPKSTPGNRTLYATVYSKGVFKSTDDGKTWALKNHGIDSNTCAFEITLAPNGVLFLAVSPTPAHRGGKKGTEFLPGAVYRSVDGAESWVRLTIAKDLVFPNSIEVDPSEPNRIYLACWSTISLSDLVGGDIARAAGNNNDIETPGGIFLSEDGGETWTSIFDQAQYVYDVTVDPYHPGRVYCNTFNKVAWQSEDRGKSWKKIKDYDFHWGHRVIPDPIDHSKVFITTYGSSVWHGRPLTE